MQPMICSQPARLDLNTVYRQVYQFSFDSVRITPTWMMLASFNLTICYSRMGSILTPQHLRFDKGFNNLRKRTSLVWHKSIQPKKWREDLGIFWVKKRLHSAVNTSFFLLCHSKESRQNLVKILYLYNVKIEGGGGP